MTSVNFKNPVINLGHIPANSRHTVYFYLKNDLDIKTLKSSCGCTTPEYQKKKSRIKVIYNAGKLPPHLIFQSLSQFIEVYYGEDGFERLYIKGIKIKG